MLEPQTASAADSGARPNPGWWQRWVMKPQNWWLPLLLVMLTGLGSLLFVGSHTYIDAPPRVDFVTKNGTVKIEEEAIIRGQLLFLRTALMDYGSMFGDGAGRGPDFTADALHRMTYAMVHFYASEQPANDEFTRDAVLARVQVELKENRYDESSQRIFLTDGQAQAVDTLRNHYRQWMRSEVVLVLPGIGKLTDQDFNDLSDFFFWGAWVCVAERPGYDYSYTNNWPFDKEAGNEPPQQVLMWSLFAILGLFLGLGMVLFLHGRFAELAGWKGKSKDSAPVVKARVVQFSPSELQRATYKYFVVAALLFLLQVFAGVVTVHNFLGLNWIFGVNLSELFSLAAARGWHLQLALLWVAACWIGGSIFVMSTVTDQVPSGQVKLVNLMFWLLVIMVAGNLTGVVLGPTGVLGQWWNFLGNQGWEFVEMGKLWQGMLMGILMLWALILWRSLRLVWRRERAWALPNWLLYCVIAVMLLFISGFIATPETNFAIADFWRWAVVHMWVEAFFEVFATILVAYFMYLMGFVSHQGAARVVYIATLLFLGSGLLGLSHNFYWNAKPVATLAVGSVFSTLQVVPLILLTLEAWQFRQLPSQALARAGVPQVERAHSFAQSSAFLFLLGVNFWNFMGAGVLGFLINLPIVNYYEHGTYLTVNHGHAAFMGVYGNLSLATIVFCSRYLISAESWNDTLFKRIFWSLNIGLLLMVLMDLLPVGFHQFATVMEQGFWFARSEEYIQSQAFQILTWARILGGLLFVFGGVLPLVYFMITRGLKLKDSKIDAEDIAAEAEPA